MPKIKVLAVNVKHTNKDGVPFKNDSAMVGIKTVTKTNEEVWLNGFVENRNLQYIQKDTEIDVEVTKDEKWGWQFKLIIPPPLTEQRVREIVEEMLKARSLDNVTPNTTLDQDIQNIAEAFGGEVVSP